MMWNVGFPSASYGGFGGAGVSPFQGGYAPQQPSYGFNFPSYQPQAPSFGYQMPAWSGGGYGGYGGQQDYGYNNYPQPNQYNSGNVLQRLIQIINLRRNFNIRILPPTPPTPVGGQETPIEPETPPPPRLVFIPLGSEDDNQTNFIRPASGLSNRENNSGLPGLFGFNREPNYSLTNPATGLPSLFFTSTRSDQLGLSGGQNAGASDPASFFDVFFNRPRTDADLLNRNNNNTVSGTDDRSGIPTGIFVPFGNNMDALLLQARQLYGVGPGFRGDTNRG